VEHTGFRSGDSLAHLSRKPFCSNLLYYSHLILTKQKKVLRRLLLLYGIQSVVIYGLKLLVNRERPLFSWRWLQTLQRSRRNFGSKFSKCPYRLCFYDGYPFSLLVSPLSNHFLHHCWIYWMDPNLFRPSLSTDVIPGALLGYGLTKLFLLYSPLFPKK